MADQGEKQAIARIVMEDRFGLELQRILAGASMTWDERAGD